MTALTRDEWVAACSARYADKADLAKPDADELAEIAAGIEEDEHGTWNVNRNTTASWTDPVEAADNDMECWDDDGCY